MNDPFFCVCFPVWDDACTSTFFFFFYFFPLFCLSFLSLVFTFSFPQWCLLWRRVALCCCSLSLFLQLEFDLIWPDASTATSRRIRGFVLYTVSFSNLANSNLYHCSNKCCCWPFEQSTQPNPLSKKWRRPSLIQWFNGWFAPFSCFVYVPASLMIWYDTHLFLPCLLDFIDARTTIHPSINIKSSRGERSNCLFF